MAWVTATRNPNSQQSLYGDTAANNNTEDIFSQPSFWQNPDGSFQPGSDPTQMREPDYQSDSNTMQGQNVYSDQFQPMSQNPQWWDKVSSDPLIAGRNLYDIPDWKSNPAISDLLQKAQDSHYEQYGKKGGSLLGGILEDPGLQGFLGVVGAGTGVLGGLGAFGGAGAAEAAGAGAATGAGTAISPEALDAAWAGEIGTGGAAETTFGAGAAASGGNALGLTQMGEAAGLSGQSLDDFVASGGTAGSTAAGGGGVGFGAAGGGPAQLPSITGPQTTNAPAFGNPLDATAATLGGQTPAINQLPDISGPQAQTVSSGATSTGASSLPSGGTGIDYSAYTGDTPTDIANPLADETISPSAESYTSELPKTPPTPSTKGGDKGEMQKYIDAALKYGPGAVGLVNMLVNKGASQKTASEIANIGAPQRAIGNQLISQYQSGQLNPADKYAVDQWEQGAITQARAYYAKAGISDSSMATGAEADIKARATAMRQEALNNVLKIGMDALNVTDKYQAQAIQAEMAGDQATSQSAMQFLNSYGAWLRALPTLTGEKQPVAATA